MDAPPLIVATADVGTRAGLPVPLNDQDQALITAAIVEAQVDLEAYLGRPVTPREFTQTGCIPYLNGWDLAEDPVLQVISSVSETGPDGRETGRYTVTYRAGLDGANDPDLAPLRRYVTVHAAYAPQVMQRATDGPGGRVEKSLSVEGQSVTYENAYTPGVPGSGTPGSLPTLSSCDRWRRSGRRVYRGRSPWWDGWPYDYYDFDRYFTGGGYRFGW